MADESIKVFGVFRSGDNNRKLCGEFDSLEKAEEAAKRAASICPGWCTTSRGAISPYRYEVVPYWRSSTFGPPDNKLSVL